MLIKIYFAITSFFCLFHTPIFASEDQQGLQQEEDYSLEDLKQELEEQGLTENYVSPRRQTEKTENADERENEEKQMKKAWEDETRAARERLEKQVRERLEKERRERLAREKREAEERLAKEKLEEGIKQWRQKLFEEIVNFNNRSMIYSLTGRNHDHADGPISENDQRTLLMLAIEENQRLEENQLLDLIDLLLNLHFDPTQIPDHPGYNIISYYKTFHPELFNKHKKLFEFLKRYKWRKLNYLTIQEYLNTLPTNTNSPSIQHEEAEVKDAENKDEETKEKETKDNEIKESKEPKKRSGSINIPIPNFSILKNLLPTSSRVSSSSSSGSRSGSTRRSAQNTPVSNNNNNNQNVDSNRGQQSNSSRKEENNEEKEKGKEEKDKSKTEKKSNKTKNNKASKSAEEKKPANSILIGSTQSGPPVLETVRNTTNAVNEVQEDAPNTITINVQELVDVMEGTLTRGARSGRSGTISGSTTNTFTNTL